VGFFDRDEHRRGTDPLEMAEVGDLPPAAQARLSRARTSGLSTSTLSAGGFATVSTLGLRPLAQVLGASIYQIGSQNLPHEAQWAGDGFAFPLMTVNGAWSEARRLAFDRLRDEARAVGADAVVAVHLRRGEPNWARRCVDYVVSGTAVRLATPAGAVGPSSPILSDLSAQDYWKLHSCGCGPVGIVASTSVMFVSQGQGARWRRRVTVMSNQELPEYSEGFSHARRAAVIDLRDQARTLGADGVVGVSLEYAMSQAELAVDLRGGTATGLSISSIALGGDMSIGGGGADKRTGMIFTVHAVGTAMKRKTPGEPGPEVSVRLGLKDR
jgi:uncharacterized protein YbjQ (UPF0145 family)